LWNYFFNSGEEGELTISNDDAPKHAGQPSAGPAFLLAQLGAHAARKFAERIAVLELSPPHAGILGILARTPGLSQRALAKALGTLPSRLVTFIDELEAKGLVERRPDEADRRNNALRLTETGQVSLAALGRIARAHQSVLLAALSPDEQQQLASLLQRVADEQGLLPFAHPGYRSIGD
jgi:DNA-binding MarR family transcriptional regulator